MLAQAQKPKSKLILAYVSAASPETKEQAVKRRKTNRERVEETRALEIEEQTVKCR